MVFSETGQTTYFKFYIAPIIASAVYIITLMKWQWIQRYLFLVLFGTSLFIIIGGARSLGFSMFFTTFALLLYNKYKTIKLKRIIPGLIIATIIILIYFIIYLLFHVFSAMMVVLGPVIIIGVIVALIMKITGR